MIYKKMMMILVAVIGLGFMTLTLNAGEMKCGAGKCGSMSGSKDMKLPGCDSDECVSIDCKVKKDATSPHSCKDCSCGDKKETGKVSGNESAKAAMKCGGSMKCGTGKCGKSN